MVHSARARGMRLNARVKRYRERSVHSARARGMRQVAGTYRMQCGQNRLLCLTLASLTLGTASLLPLFLARIVRGKEETMLATFLAVCLTAQIISQGEPKTGDTVALIDQPVVRGWSRNRGLDQEPDKEVPSGSFAIYRDRTSARPYTLPRSQRNPAIVAGSAAAAHVMAMARQEQIAAGFNFYYHVQLVPSREPFTCFNGQVWLIPNVDQAKACYAAIASEVTKIESKKRVGDKKHIRQVIAKEMNGVGARAKKQFGISPEAFDVLMACGRTNKWPVNPAK